MLKCPYCEKEINSYSPAQIFRRTGMEGYLFSLFQSCYYVYENSELYANNKVYLNERLLLEALKNSVCDMFRLTFFRGISHADDHKRAAYAIKWLARIRPVVIRSLKSERLADDAKKTTLNSNDTYDLSTIQANAYFAVMCGLQLLPRWTSANSSFAESAVIGKYIDNLIYLLHYHSVDAESLAAEIYLLDEYVNNLS
ncbi:MAG: hypothetical protein LBP75_10630 [Planctomycetota bacterium]|jgi:hypothetical protein|nr:hypothetical protein [Planctomycetota bacterium]